MIKQLLIRLVSRLTGRRVSPDDGQEQHANPGSSLSGLVAGAVIGMAVALPVALLATNLLFPNADAPVSNTEASIKDNEETATITWQMAGAKDAQGYITPTSSGSASFSLTSSEWQDLNIDPTSKKPQLLVDEASITSGTNRYTRLRLVVNTVTTSRPTIKVTDTNTTPIIGTKHSFTDNSGNEADTWTKQLSATPGTGKTYFYIVDENSTMTNNQRIAWDDTIDNNADRTFDLQITGWS